MLAKAIAACVAAAFITGCAQRPPLPPPLADMSAQHFLKTASVKDDSLDTYATISTEPGYSPGPTENYHFLRAFVDKKTGDTSMQLYQAIWYSQYGGGGLRRYQTVNFQTPDGPASTAARVLANDGGKCPRDLNLCTHYEVVGLDVAEELLRTLARNGTGWEYKFIAQSGEELRVAMVTGEIAGFLQAVDAYRAAKGLPRPR